MDAERIVKGAQIARNAIAAYDALVDRAVLAVGYVSNREYARLSIDGETATITSPNLEYSYGDSYIEAEREYFPAAVLAMDEETFAKWNADAKARQEAMWAEQRKVQQAEQEAEERRALAILQAQYGSKP